MGPAAPQRQHHLHRRGSSPDHREGGCAVGILGGDEGQGRLQWLDRDAFSAGPADGTDIQAEQTEAEGRAFCEEQAALAGVQAGDLRLHEGHTGAIAEGAQIDGGFLRWVDPGDQGGNHARIKRCTAAVDQQHRTGRPSGWIHGPAFEDQRVAVASAGQQQWPGRTHGVDR